MGFQTQFESFSANNRCRFARQDVPESVSGVRKRSFSHLERHGRQFVLAARTKSPAVGQVRDRRKSVDYMALTATDVGVVHHQTVTSRHVTSRHVTSRHVTSRHVTSRHVTSRHVTSRHVTSRHVTSRHVTSHHITSHHIISYHIISYHIISIGGRKWQSDC